MLKLSFLGASLLLAALPAAAEEMNNLKHEDMIEIEAAQAKPAAPAGTPADAAPAMPKS